MIRRLLNFGILLGVKVVSRTFWRHRIRWVGEVPEKPWTDFRVVAVLNHTSLFEWVWAGSTPARFLWRTAGHGLVPAADKTINRPVVGRFFKLLAPQMVPITREADHTWQAVMERVDRDSMVIIFPEGRMKRADGLDKQGKPMTVRGGIADILDATPEGSMLLAYSAGLHHVQVPGQHIPRLFKTIELRLETIDIAEYREALGSAGEDLSAFKRRVKKDLAQRRDRYCPPGPGNPVPQIAPRGSGRVSEWPNRADPSAAPTGREARPGS